MINKNGIINLDRDDILDEQRYSSVLIIGGGIAGIQSAIDLADMGIEVNLVETKPSIGGRMAQLDKTFPTNDCSICILSPKMAEFFRHPKITLHTLSEVRHIVGSVGHFSVKILKKARYVKAECVACGDCVAKCPIKVQDEFDMELKNRRAIYLYFLQALPMIMTIDRDHCLFLTKGICRICEKFCTRGAIDFEQKDEEIELKVGAIIVATGFDSFNPSCLPQYGYKKCKNVVTALEYERLISASGPTGGHLIRFGDRKPVENIAFIQCIGSRDTKNNPYCSSVCCMHSVKEAILAREHDPKVQSYVFYIDVRAPGKNFQSYVSRGENEYGINYVRGRVSEITEDEEGSPIIWYEDIVNAPGPKKLKVDLVVLATSLIPRRGASELAKILKIDLDHYNFFKTDPTEPFNSSRKGIFICGCCREPCDIPDSVAQASGAAAKAAEAVVGGR